LSLENMTNMETVWLSETQQQQVSDKAQRLSKDKLRDLLQSR